MNIKNVIENFIKKKQSVVRDVAMEELLDYHDLAGLCYALELPFIKSNINFYLKKWKENLQRQILYQSLWEELLKNFHRTQLTPPLPLKGLAMLDLLYKDYPGARHLGDIDLLVEHQNFLTTEKIILSLGFKQIFSPKWHPNSHKYNYHRIQDNQEEVIELHSHAYTGDDQYLQNFKQNSIHFYLTHMILHYGQQHTYLYLFWGIEILLFIEHFQKSIDFDQIISHFENIGEVPGFYSTIYALSQISPHLKEAKYWKQWKNWRRPFLQILITENFLWEPKKNILRYLLIKFLIKGSIFNSIRYFLIWPVVYGRTVFRRRHSTI